MTIIKRNARRLDTRTKVGAATSNPIERPAYGWSRAVAKNPPFAGH
jgi:hypothetical protein